MQRPEKVAARSKSDWSIGWLRKAFSQRPCHRATIQSRLFLNNLSSKQANLNQTLRAQSPRKSGFSYLLDFLIFFNSP